MQSLVAGRDRWVAGRLAARTPFAVAARTCGAPAACVGAAGCGDTLASPVSWRWREAVLPPLRLYSTTFPRFSLFLVQNSKPS
jgi:hypothetical protein